MKIPTITVIALACAGLAPLCGEKTGKAQVLKSRPTQADLAKRVAVKSNPLTEHSSVKALAGDPLKKKEKRDLGGLIQRSTILAFGGYWTFVPRGSVLHAPPLYQSRLVSKPEGTLLPWADFYARNRGWIMAQPVAITNARGEESLSEEVLETHRTVGRIVVAVLHNGPISVKPPVVPENAEAAPTPTTTK